MLILSVMLLNTSCDKEEKGEQPNLPPIETMLLSFDDFPSVDVKADAKIQSYSIDNVSYALNQLVFWNSMVFNTMLMPRLSYEYMLQQEPEYVGNNTWEWTYSFTFEEQEFVATLTGKRINDEKFSMVMNLSLASVPLAKMKYFEGECSYDHSYAVWEIYEYNDGGSTKVIDIEWSEDPDIGNASLKYTYVKQGQEETNHAITWTYNPDATYDMGYFIDLQDTDTYIEWNNSTKAGRIKAEGTVGAFDWLCWDYLLHDIACPAI